jgi:hypothetical protein
LGEDVDFFHFRFSSRRDRRDGFMYCTLLMVLYIPYLHIIMYQKKGEMGERVLGYHVTPPFSPVPPRADEEDAFFEVPSNFWD